MGQREGTAKRRTAGFATDELVSLAERVVYLQAFRVGAAVVVLASALLGRRVVGATFADLILATAVYVMLAATVEALRRMSGTRSLFMISAMLLVDGVYLAWALYSTGAAQSPLRFLVYLHLIAVTLLASYRTGLKIALWHSLMFFVVYYAQAAEILEPTESALRLGPETPEFTTTSVFNVMSFWMVAIGTAIFSSLNERELRRRRQDLEGLAGMAARLEHAQDSSEVAETLLQSVCDVFGFKRGVIFGSERTGAPLLAARVPGEIAEHPPGIDPVVEEAWVAKKPQLRKKLDPEVDPRITSIMPFVQNAIVIPLFAEGERTGAVILEHPRSAGGRLEKRVMKMIEQFCAHGALALRNSELQQEVKRLADTDGLTGLANRRTFERSLERELSRAARNGEPVTLMMVDVDHFKHFNDTYGHQAGDEVLRQVGAALENGSRDFDTPARYGGEEFAVILPACSSKESLKTGERLRTLVGSVDAVAPVTASAGVATYPVHATDAHDLIKAADEALYESKQAGRDRLTRSRRRAVRSTKPQSAHTDSAVDLPPEDVTT